MRKEEESIKYRVVIKTNALAASFYEELCAFVTGQVSEIDTSNSRRFRAPSEVRSMFEASMERRLGADNHWSPVYPCDDTNSFELYFKEKPTPEMVQIIKDGCEEFSDEKKEKNPIMTRIEIIDIKVLQEKTINIYEEVELY